VSGGLSTPDFCVTEGTPIRKNGKAQKFSVQGNTSSRFFRRGGKPIQKERIAEKRATVAPICNRSGFKFVGRNDLLKTCRVPTGVGTFQGCVQRSSDFGLWNVGVGRELKKTSGTVGGSVPGAG